MSSSRGKAAHEAFIKATDQIDGYWHEEAYDDCNKETRAVWDDVRDAVIEDWLTNDFVAKVADPRPVSQLFLPHIKRILHNPSDPAHVLSCVQAALTSFVFETTAPGLVAKPGVADHVMGVVRDAKERVASEYEAAADEEAQVAIQGA